MSIEILMPALSPTMTEGSLTKWHVKVGEKVKPGDVIADIETDKATMEVEAVDEGVILEILIKEGATSVKVNSPIALVQAESSKLTKNNVKNLITKDIKSKVKKQETSIDNQKRSDTPIKNKKSGDKIFSSPLVKKISNERNLNLINIKGSGPKGRIIKRDLENINNKKENLVTSSSIKEIIKPNLMRKVIADRTTYTKKNVPHFYLKIESNVDKLLDLRKKINENIQNDKISINDILIKGLAMAQFNNPKTNVSWSNGEIIRYSSVDVSVAVALNEGLITPIIKNANEKGLLEISNEMRQLTKKARDGKLSPDEYTGGTISISNLGMFNISEFGAIINPPQSSILAVGTIQKVPRIIENKIVPVSILYSTLSADHRVLDGAIAAQLLKDFNDIIENPFNIWLQSNDMEII